VAKMLSRILPAIALAIAIPITAHAADQFDLICHGLLQDQDGASKIERKYHVDLSSRKWCEDSCKETFSISDINKDQIILRNSEQTGLSTGDVSDKEYIDMTNMTAHELQIGPHFGGEFKGSCVMAPFSGLAKPNP
jgi:hypothetical protein